MNDNNPRQNDGNLKVRRGPYKKYVLHESVSQIPPSTKRNWRGKRKQARQKQCGQENPISTRHKTPEKQSLENVAANPKIEIKDSFETFSHEARDASILGNREFTSEITACENLKRNIELEDLGNKSNTPEVPKRTYPEEKYTDDFLIKCLVTLATKLRFNFMYEAAESVFKLLSAMNATSTPHPSKYFLKKIISEFSKSVTVHRICDSCERYAGIQVDEMLCPHCKSAIDSKSSERSGNSFLYISLEYQLREIFELKTAHETCEMPRQKLIDSAIEDIYDGELYKKNFVPGMLSVNGSVDGAPVFESSNYSIYPILCTVNELKPRERNKRVILCGLWFGSGSPPMNEYLQPFVNEATILNNHGFTYVYNGKSYSKKCRVLLIVCDSAARPQLRNTTRFNGKYGCGLCLHPGESIKKGQGITRVYPLIGPEKNPFGEGLRTHEQTLDHAEQRIKGVKGRSILCDIPNFDIVACLDVDWMHAVALGVCRQFAKLWFDTAYHQEEFYIGFLIDDINRRILSYTPTLEVSRTPRSMSDRVHWKAHEWVIWLLFYSLPTLSAFLPRKYVNHWALLVDAIQLLCKLSIMRSEIVLAERWLIEFTAGVEELYGRKYLSFNVHLLTHLGESVRKFGPLWTHSAFVYENANQVLLKYVKSSNGVAEQICDMFRAKYVVDRLYAICFKKMTKEQREYVNNVLQKKVIPEPTLILNNAGMLGAASMHVELPRTHYLAFHRANVHIHPDSPIASYKRVIKGDEVVHSKSYTLVEKRADYYVQLIDDEIFEIELFYVIAEGNDVSCYALGRYFEKQKKSLIAGRKLDHLIVLKNIIDNLAVINVNMIKQKVCVLSVQHMQLWVACVHPNRYELLT